MIIRLTHPATRVVSVIASLGLMVTMLLAQTGQSSIVGTTKDSSGAVVPGVIVTVTNEATNVATTVTTNEAGLYEVPFLGAGTYTVRAELDGFRSETRTGIRAEIRQVARVDFDLKPAQINEQVVVQATAPLLTTDSAEVGKVISRDEVSEMPLNTRDFASLQILTPGAVPGIAVGNFSGITLSEGFMIAGGNQYSGSYSVEGADNNRTYYYGNATSPSLEIIQGVKIQTSGSSSEYGGGTHHVDVALKSGGNQFHGSLFEYNQNDFFSARNAFSGATPPKLRRNQFGGSFSGPIVTDKLFFIGVYEGLRQRQGNVNTVQVATQDERNGIFSTPIIDPLTGSPFPNNQIPANRFSPVARYFLDNIWPLPNTNVRFFRRDQVPTVDFDQVDFKFDYAHDRRNTFTLRLSHTERPYVTPQSALISDQVQIFRNSVLALNYTRTFSPQIINTFLASARRDFFDGTSRSTLDGVDFIGAVGMNLGGPTTAGLPNISISGTGFTGTTGQQFNPADHHGNVFQFQNTLRWMHGRHSVNMGAQLTRYQNTELDNGSSRGVHQYNGRYSNSGLADFFLGLPNQITFQPESGNVYLRNFLWSAYVQDDWKIRDNLTLNLGLRYEYIAWATEIYNRLSVADPLSGRRIIVASDTNDLPPSVDPIAVGAYPPGTFVSSNQAGMPRTLREPDRNNFGPRFGFAYRPGNDITIRGGYGINYLRNAQAVINDRNHAFGLPFRFNRVIVNPDAATFNILTPFQAFTTTVANTIESARYTDPNFVLSYTQSWSLNVEQRLPGRSVLDIGYVGNRQVHAKQGWQNYNQSFNWPNRNDRFPGYTLITLFASGGDSRYDSLQVQLRKQTTHGLFAHLNYTWSKNLTNIWTDSDTAPIHIYNPSLLWGRSRFSRTHVVTGDFIYRLPVGRGQALLANSNRLVDGILGGWQVSGIIKMWSGIPLTVISSVARARLSAQGTVPADRLSQGSLDQGTRNLWFDTTAFAQPPASRPGTSGYGVIDGPGAVTEDLGLFKTFAVSEGIRLQLRLEAYNAFNHVNLADPGVDLDNATTFARITASGAARRVQMAVRIDF